MKKLKRAGDRLMATKTIEKGLIIDLTGNGKGKSSSGFGMILRAIGHGMPCAEVQYIKGSMQSAERDLLKERISDICPARVMGEGFTKETQDRARAIEMATAAWEQAKELLRDPAKRMVRLDEVNITLKYEYLDAEEVADFLLTEKPELTHIIPTGRNAADVPSDVADLVSEVKDVKHPFRDQGVVAQPGVEF